MVRVWLLVVVLVLGGGCASRRDAGPVDPAERVDVAAVVMRSDPGATFVLDPSRGGVERITRRVEEVEEGLIEVDLGAVGYEVWRRGEGGWRMTSQVDRIDGVRLAYEPGMPLRPDRLAPGEAWEGSGSVRIVELKDGSLRESGSYRTRVLVEVTASGLRLHERRRLDLRLAEVTVETRWDFDGRAGLVDQDSAITTHVLGLFPTREDRRIYRSGRNQD
ncbi:hypothetical protein [Mucisphaera calidilacus]|uniref:Lipoprotein n=1 Tax=Mucisphaera calidilacus TaxID=2527982 RepID=A0A518BZ89_9BACT|nr:hypothetical protein [Mucisphaera calidilacus]QDU72284.1 hypothetical protein Pan265_21480 [Mucisphaera calidilacus]